MTDNPIYPWEKIHSTVTETTDRLEVPGGWIYRCTFTSFGLAMVYVPDPEVEEEQYAHDR